MMLKRHYGITAAVKTLLWRYGTIRQKAIQLGVTLKLLPRASSIQKSVILDGIGIRFIILERVTKP